MPAGAAGFRDGRRPLMPDDPSDAYFEGRVATFIDTSDVSALRLEWGNDVFEKIVAHVWDRIPFLMWRVMVLEKREIVGRGSDEGA
jgi:hypothetical protein